MAEKKILGQIKAKFRLVDSKLFLSTNSFFGLLLIIRCSLGVMTDNKGIKQVPGGFIWSKIFWPTRVFWDLILFSAHY